MYFYSSLSITTVTLPLSSLSITIDLNNPMTLSCSAVMSSGFVLSGLQDTLLMFSLLLLHLEVWLCVLLTPLLLRCQLMESAMVLVQTWAKF